MKSVSYYQSILIICSLFFIASCATIEPSGSHPPATRPIPTKPRPVVVTKPKPRAVIKKPRIKPTKVKPPVVKTVIKPPKVKIRIDEPEQGENPYNNVPSRASAGSKPSHTDTGRNSETSPAVKSLLLQAKAAMLIKRNAAAIEKLERALRIDPQNPTIWHQLAQAHYNQEEDASAISMAKKSNFYVNEGSPLEKQNWQLIMAASKRSENIKTLKAAIQYERAHP